MRWSSDTGAHNGLDALALTKLDVLDGLRGSLHRLQDIERTIGSFRRICAADGAEPVSETRQGGQHDERGDDDRTLPAGRAGTSRLEAVRGVPCAIIRPDPIARDDVRATLRCDVVFFRLASISSAQPSGRFQKLDDGA